MKSKKILLFVSGKEKSKPPASLLRSRKQFPTSFLWKHQDVTVIADAEALMFE
ncbi:hypothetical protein [Bacillus changyiensis]|uniref:hypothetical protein n=1 Tax=Bacillus changyiensis TaxID=3004103 RepID=UPI003977B169